MIDAKRLAMTLVTMTMALGLSVPVRADVTPTATWNAPSGSVWVDNAGNVVIVNRLTVQKRNSAGSVLWTVTLTHGLDFSNHLVFDSANNMYLDAWEDDRLEGNASVTVARITAGGTVSWTIKYAVGGLNQTEHMSEGPMIIAPNGNLYVLGREGQASDPPYGAKLFRINTSTGAQVSPSRSLTPTFDASGAGMPDSALAADASSNIYYGSPAGLFSFSADLTTERWLETQFTMPVRAVTVDRWNNVYVTGTVFQLGKWRMYVARVNSASGTTTWANIMPGGLVTNGTYPAPTSNPNPQDPNPDERVFGGNAIAIDSKGYVWAAGRGSEIDFWDGGLVLKLAPADGAFMWSHHYGFNFSDGAVVDMVLDAYDNVFVTGKQATIFVVDPVPPLVEMLGPKAASICQTGVGPTNFYQENTHLAVDKKGNFYWANFSSDDTRVITSRTVFASKLTGRSLTGIATSPGTGKTRLLMDTFNHQNILLETFSSADVLQMATTSWNYGTYGRHDVDISSGPDGSTRILQQLDFNGTTSAAVQVLVRDDAGNLPANPAPARNVTNLRALKIATGSDNKSYVLLRSTVNGGAEVWRMSATGAFEANATFAAQTNRAPSSIAADGTSIVYLIWEGLDGQLFPWRLNTSLAITNQTASLNPGGHGARLAGSGVGGDHQLRFLVDFPAVGSTLFSLSSSGALLRTVAQPFNGGLGSGLAIGLSVGGDNRSHLLDADGTLGMYQYNIADANLNQTSVQRLSIPAN